MDVLADVLRALKLKGTVYFQADFRAPWGMDIKGGQANFHVVTKGRCWLRVGQSAPLCLGEGDLAIFPKGERHALLHQPDAEAAPAESVLAKLSNTEAGVVYEGEGVATSLICGHFEYDRSDAHPLMDALPSLIHISKGSGSDWLSTATQLAVLESASGTPGSSAVVDRLAEVLLLQIIRAYLIGLQRPEGFLGAVSDPSLSAALSLIHEAPERPWSLNELAQHAGQSRSVFAARFKEATGLGPMQYLTQWRMSKAKELLTTSELSIAQIAERVGYQSEWAFAKAFKRHFDEGPGSARRSAKRSA